MRVRFSIAVVLTAFMLAACGGGPAPYATTVGVLHPGERIMVRIARGTVNAYAPLIGQRKDIFTVQAFAKRGGAAPPLLVHKRKDGIEIDAPPLQSLLVRVPRGVTLRVISGGGDVNATDISGNANVTLAHGNADLMLPDYGQARDDGSGTLKILIGSSDWPGTLRFYDAKGTINLSINENASFHVRMHTGNGTIFTDFPLRGHAHGTSETIVGVVNGGAKRAVDIEVGVGTIRLLSLAPQY